MKKNYLSFFKSSIKYLKIVSILTILFGTSWSGFGQTTLAVGDISVVGFNSANPDKIAFVLLKDIAANTIINFTDNGFTAPTTGRTGEGFLTYTAPANQPAGTVIFWTNGQAIIGTGWNSAAPTNFALNAAGDQLFIFQGNTANWATQSGISLLWGGNFGTALSATSSASNTVQPSALTGSSFLNLPTSTFANSYFANGSMSATSVTVSNSASNLFTLFGDGTKWFGTSSAIATFPTYTITVTSNSSTIITSGALSAVNTTYGTASITSTSFTVSGSNLTNDILITPPLGYEISQTVGGASGYNTTQTLTQSGGIVSNTTIYVRLKADATVAGSPYSGNIVLSSTGATAVNVATVSSIVSPKALTITGISADNKGYDGNTTASLSGTPAYSGLENAETFSVSGTPTASFSTATAGNAKTVSVSGYTVPSTNYSLSQPILSANITPAILTITDATASNKVYDGNNSATVTGTLSGVIGSETVTLNPSGTFSQTGIGTTLAVTSTSTISGIDAGNYSLTQPSGLSADIIAKPLTITGLTANNKVFDGNTTATLSGTAILNGVVSGEESNVILTGTPTANFAQSTVGNGIAVTVTGFSLTGSGSGNYTVSQPSGLTADITNSPSPVINSLLTASATYGIVSTSYFITATNTPTSFNATGLPTGLTINTTTGEISGTPTEIVGSPFSVNITATNNGGTGTATLVYTINPKALTISSPSIPNKVYDRTNAASIAGTLTGIIGTDVVTLNGTGTFSQATVGNALAVTSTATLGGVDAAKYTLTQPSGLTADITTLALTVTTPVAQNKVFDGNTNATITGTLSGVISPDVVTFLGTGTFASSAVGNAIAVTSTSTLGGANAANYSLTQPTGLTANITASPSLTEVILPQFIQGNNGTNTNRIPFAFRLTLSNLMANATYRYFNGVVIPSDIATSNGAGNIIFPNAGTWVRSTGPGLSSVGNYGEFTTDATGNYTGWFIIEPSGNATRFVPGNDVLMRINLNNGAGGTSVVTRLTTTNTVKVINTVASAGANNGTGFRGNSGATPKNFVFVYDNETGTGRPLSGSFVESDGTVNTTANSYSSFYSTNVEGIAGAYGLIIPNVNPNGVRRIEQLDFATGTIAGCVATDADGVWTSGANTVNPVGGTTAIAVSLTDAPLNTCVVTNTPPTILVDVATTSNFVDGGIATSPSGSLATSGVINDTTDPAKNFGIDFTIGDAETAIGNLTVTATSSNLTVLPSSNLNLTGSGASRNLKITPNAEGFSDVTVTVNDGITTSSFTINYASSVASINPSTTRFHTGVSDASTAQVIDNNLMIVADDENQALRMYDRINSGLPINSFDFTTSLGLTDISGGNPREVDIEASAKVGNRIYWMGSHSNASSGNNRPNRSRFFATDISGTGNSTTLSYTGRYDNLKTELLAWDANNGHGLGANFLGLSASSATGIAPEIADGSGFNIEGFEIAPNNSTAYICFRAPLQTTTTRTKALIIPLTNFADLVSGNPTSTTATFGNPIQLDLGGRAIREMKKNAAGEYLIIAGPHDVSTGTAPKDFRFYTWTGNPNDAPILRSANLTALNSGGSFESIVDLPSPLLANTNLQILVDNGDAVFYGNGIIAKDLPQNNHKKFRSETINLGTEILPLVTIKSITTGAWESTSTWDLGRIPQAGDLVIIDQNHEVTLNGNGSANKILYQGTGKLIFSSTTSILNTGL